MANARFNLKNPKSTTATLINLFYSYDGKRLKYSTGEKVEPKAWNSEKQKVSKSYTGSGDINFCLEDIKEKANSIYRQSKLTQQELSNQLFKEQLDEVLKSNKKKASTFFEVFDVFIESRKPMFNSRTIQKYTTLQNHLKDFQSKNRFKIDFNSIDSKFYDSLILYYTETKKLLNNSTGKYIATLKTFLSWALDEGYNTNTNYRKFTVPKNEVDIIYLKDSELTKLYEFDLSKNKRLEKVRDAFCLACYSGLRFSDIEALRPENISLKNISLTIYKTKEPLQIPIVKKARAIIDKYIKQPFFLGVISNQKMNDYLKELAELVGIDSNVTIVKFRGKERIEVKKPKFEFISTHTARRTFITLSLEKGMRPEVVMKITGHKSYNTFQKYIKIVDKIKDEEMKKAWDEEPILKKVI